MCVPQKIISKVMKTKHLPSDINTARAKTITQGPSEFSRQDILPSKIRLNIHSKEKLDTVRDTSVESI